MAKALFGHVGGTSDLRLVVENRRLVERVRELEAEVARLRRVNTELADTMAVDDELLLMSDAEPALT